MTAYAYDVETHLIQPGIPAPRLVCGAVADADREWVMDREDAIAWFRQALADKHELFGVNFVFDLSVMVAADPSTLVPIFEGIDAGRLTDVGIAEALHDNASGLMYVDPKTQAPIGRYSLAYLEARHTGVDRSADKGEDGWRLRYAELDGIPLEKWPDEAKAYPRRDARGTYRVRQAQHAHVNQQCLAQEMRAAWMLRLASCWGMRTDPELVAQVVGRIRAEHELSRRKYAEAGIVRVKTTAKDETPDDISREWLEEFRRGLPADAWADRRRADVDAALRALGRGRSLRFATDTARLSELVTAAYDGSPELTATGRVSTSRDTLAESDDELLEGYAAAGVNEKLLAAFVDVMEHGTRAPINPEGNSLVSSQRTSYRKPNLQQLPREGGIRETFVPRPGWVLVSVDYNQLELCSLSQVNINLFGHAHMADAINAGQDLHLKVAARLAGITHEEALAREAEPAIKNLRQASKPLNFGLPGLMGAPKLVLSARKMKARFCELSGTTPKGGCRHNRKATEYARRTITPVCEICLELGSRYRKMWYAEWQEMTAYHEYCASITDAGRAAVSFGTGMMRFDPNAGSIANHFFQNLAAQGAKHAAWRLSQEAYTDRKSVLYRNFRPVVFVHDEVIAEVREEVLHECAWRQTDVMIESMREFIPDVKISATPAACRRWFKSAEKVLDKQGRLKPYWPKDWTFGPDLKQMREDAER